MAPLKPISNEERIALCLAIHAEGQGEELIPIKTWHGILGQWRGVGTRMSCHRILEDLEANGLIEWEKKEGARVVGVESVARFAEFAGLPLEASHLSPDLLPDPETPA